MFEQAKYGNGDFEDEDEVNEVSFKEGSLSYSSTELVGTKQLSLSHIKHFDKVNFG